jgi:uncharacterized membrane protein
MPSLILRFRFASTLAAVIRLFGQPPMVFVCYFLGISILLPGLIVALRRDIPRARGLDKFVSVGPVLYAAPLAVFAGEHFTATRAMSSMVPHWIPWHFFWVLFVGVALVAAALSLATGRVAGLAATMLGVMFLLFVALIDVPFGVVAEPKSRFAWALMLRELSFSLCSFAFAGSLAKGRWRKAGERAIATARVVVGATLVFYGLEHFLHPQHVPVLPLEMALPAWMPLRWLIGYGTGAALVATGTTMAVNRHARTALTLMGVLAIGLVLVVYGPILAVKFSDVGTNLNYFADTMCYAGALLMLAGAIAPEQGERAAAAAPVVAGSRTA